MGAENLPEGPIGHWLNGRVGRGILRFSNDTRTISAGDCFIALKTDRRDGHDFLKMAAERHASCAIVSRPNEAIDLPQFVCADTERALWDIARLRRSEFNGKVIAIAGSFGKTTAKDMLRLLLDIENNATFENLNGDLGVPMTLAALNNREKFAVIEVAVDKPGDMDILADLVSPQVTIVTGIGKSHLGNMGSEEITAREKFKLLARAIGNGGRGIFPGECLKFDDFRNARDSCTVAAEGDQNAGYDMCLRRGKLHVAVALNGNRFQFAMPRTMSRGVARNFALLCMCAMECGVAPETIAHRIARWTPSRMRGEIVKTKNGTYFVDCYNANPTSFADSLEHFNRLFPGGNRLIVIGVLMESEIGESAEEENIALLRNFHRRRGDSVLLIGDGAEALAKKVHRGNIRCFDSTGGAAAAVENFHGVVYLKGHRRYALENLIV